MLTNRWATLTWSTLVPEAAACSCAQGHSEQKLQPVTVRKDTLRRHASRKSGLVWRRFLDVGSGCGVLTAAAALLVGRSGASVGIDTKRCAAELGAANVARLTTECQEYADTAAAAAFHVHNVFIPTAKHKVRFLSIAVRCEKHVLPELASPARYLKSTASAPAASGKLPRNLHPDRRFCGLATRAAAAVPLMTELMHWGFSWTIHRHVTPL